MSQQNVTVKISEHRKQILSAIFGLFLYKKPRKRPVLQAVTSFFAGDVFEDEGFLVFVQGFELFFVDDGRVDFKRVCGRKFRPQTVRQKAGLCLEKQKNPQKIPRSEEQGFLL